MSTMLMSASDAQGFIPRRTVSTGQTLLSAFIAVILLGSLAASATLTLACASLSACDSGVTSVATTLPGYGVRS